MKILILLASIAMTWGLVATFGWISITICFALALGSLVFSSGHAEREEDRYPSCHDEEHYFDASAPQGGH